MAHPQSTRLVRVVSFVGTALAYTDTRVTLPPVPSRGRSSAGRASALQAEGQGFESPRLHRTLKGARRAS